MTTFEPRTIPVPLTEDQAFDWPAWRDLMAEHIILAETEADLSRIVDLNQAGFADCCARGPNAYRTLCGALEQRRKQIQAGLAGIEQ